MISFRQHEQGNHEEEIKRPDPITRKTSREGSTTAEVRFRRKQQREGQGPVNVRSVVLVAVVLILALGFGGVYHQIFWSLTLGGFHKEDQALTNQFFIEGSKLQWETDGNRLILQDIITARKKVSALESQESSDIHENKVAEMASAPSAEVSQNQGAIKVEKRVKPWQIRNSNGQTDGEDKGTAKLQEVSMEAVKEEVSPHNSPPAASCDLLVKEKCAPYFVVIGDGVCGSSALADLLAHHPAIYPPMAPLISPDHGLGYFTEEGSFQGAFGNDPSNVDRPAKDLLDVYAKHFLPTDWRQRYTFDISPGYLRSVLAPHRMKELIPNIKAIALLCNPVERVLSVYINHRQIAKKQNRDLVFPYNLSFSSYISWCGNSSCSTIYEAEYSRGLRNYFQILGKDQVFLIDFSRFKAQTFDALIDIFNFLNISTHSSEISRIKHSLNATKLESYFSSSELLRKSKSDEIIYLVNRFQESVNDLVVKYGFWHQWPGFKVS